MTEGLLHGPGARAGRRHLRPLAAAFGLVVVFMVIEVAGGFLTGSLALLSDAGHMATDALGLGMALAAIVAADHTTRRRGRTYGLYRLEILAALANAVLLLGVGGIVIYEAIGRLNDPPEILTGPMLAIAIGGLVVNVVSWRLLRTGADASINVRGAYLEVLADMAGSIGAIGAAVVMIVTGWPYADAVVAGIIGLFIFPRAWTLGREAVRVLVEAAPGRIELERLTSDLAAIADVTDVHDVHVWTLTSEMDVATAHLAIDDAADPHPVLDQARDLLRDRYGIVHATLQVEPATHTGCTELAW